MSALLVGIAPLTPLLFLLAGADGLWSQVCLWVSVVSQVATAGLLWRGGGARTLAVVVAGPFFLLLGLLPTALDSPGVFLASITIVGLVFDPLLRTMVLGRSRLNVSTQIDLLATTGLVVLMGVVVAEGHGATLGAAGRAVEIVALGVVIALGLLGDWRAQRAGVLAESSRHLGWVLSGVGLVLISSPQLTLVLWSAQTVRVSWRGSGRWLNQMLNDLYRVPARMTVFTFLVLSVVGAVGFSFPIMTVSNRGLTLLDALFTAVSAVCVTGLSTIDVGAALSPVGQVWLLVLVQVGALGFMTLSVFAVLALGHHLALHEMGTAGQAIGSDRPGAVRHLVLMIVKLTLTIEALGALALFPALQMDGLSTGTALWHAVFHAVSAFCNAGFSLYSDSLSSRNPAVVLIISALIILGGLGFVVIAGLTSWRRGRQRLGLHAKVVISASAALLLLGTVGFALLEWRATLADVGVFGALEHSFFQSVTLRTAGFNTVDMSAIRPATAVFMLGFMFIGASPGGTGGGIKTTTLVVALLTVRALATGRAHLECFGRRLPAIALTRAVAIITISGFVVVASWQVLVATQDIDPIALLFEVVSAFGTTGVSQGATGALDPFGLLVVIALMLLGRTGPLTVALMLSRRGAAVRIEFAEEDLPVG